MKQVIVLVAMIIVGLTLFAGIVGLGTTGDTTVGAADTQVGNITTSIPAIGD